MFESDRFKVGTLLEYDGEWAYLQKFLDNGDLELWTINKRLKECVKSELKEQKLKPLKLTRTLVQKLGFKKNNPHFNKYLRSCIMIECTYDNQFKLYQLIDGNLNFIGDLVYAHELQYLYAQLTQEEVKYEKNYSIN